MSASAREIAHDYILKEYVGDDGSWSNGHHTAYMHADAILAALSAAGFVVVPREPTTAMKQAAADNSKVTDVYEAASVWASMLSAAEGKK